MSTQFPVPVLTSVGTLFPGDEIKFSQSIWSAPSTVDSIHPLGNGEYRVVTHRDQGDARETKARTIHGEFTVWLIAAGDLFNHAD